MTVDKKDGAVVIKLEEGDGPTHVFVEHPQGRQVWLTFRASSRTVSALTSDPVIVAPLGDGLRCLWYTPPALPEGGGRRPLKTTVHEWMDQAQGES